MNLEDPVPVYSAASDVEANQIAEILISKGIPAFAFTDSSAFDPIGGIHKSDVLVERHLVSKAETILGQLADERSKQNDAIELDGGPIEVQCEECGETSVFAKELNGTTQECEKCKAYVDVGDLPWEEDWGEPED